ncbi:cytochrome c oxidase subunit 5b-1, mitochondrial-like, partial [Morus notabilis]
MWRRLLSSSNLKTLTLAAAATPCRSASGAVRLVDRFPVSASSSLFAGSFSTDSADKSIKKKVEDVMPIATGHEREELEAELE